MSEAFDGVIQGFFLVAAGDNFLLFFVGIVVFIAIALAVYALLIARLRAERDVASLIAARERAIAQLNEAEEIGHVGSFTWDYENPEDSFWSREMYDLFGLIPRKKTPGPEEVGKYVHEGDKERFDGAWRRAFSQSGDFSFHVRVRATDGQLRNLQFQGRTTLGGDKKPKVVRGVVHDVTKEMEVDRAKSEFVSLASHQLKTPLTSIKWLSEMLIAEGAEPLTEKQEQYIRNIKASAQQMVEMVNDLLNMSRIELGTLAMTITEFDIDKLARDVLAEQQHAAELKKVKVVMTSDPKFPRMYGDEKLTRMILQNLLSNAIKYSKDGGTVEYELSLVSAPKDTIYIRVKDSGIGIPEKDKEKIFERLFRAENAQKLVPDGTGLGLYVIKVILARAGGNITFESEEGKGTTFYVTIPVLWNIAPGGEKPSQNA